MTRGLFVLRPKRKLTEADRMAIRRHFKTVPRTGENIRLVAAIYKVHPSTVQKAVLYA